MSHIIISGASGDLGRRVTELLLAEAPQQRLTLVSRTPEKLAHRVGNNVDTRRGDYQDMASLEAAYQGGETLLLISGLNIGHRVQEHRNAIEAARKAGIRYVVYTSVGGVQPKNPALSAIDHYQTELDLRASGLEFVFLRNALYAEIVTNYVVRSALETGEISMAAGDGHIAPVSKLDVMRCVARCLMEPEQHAGAVYEVTGPELLSFGDIARIGSEFHGVPIEYKPANAEDRLAFFDSIGYPRTFRAGMKKSADGHLWASDELISAELAVCQGFQSVMSHHVKMITGRDPEPLRSVFERCKGKRYDEL